MVEKSEVSPNPADWWSQFYAPVRQFGERVAEFFSPNSEAATTDNAYEITVELPGVSEDEITVEVHDGKLTVTGEKRAAREEKGKNYYFSERVYGSFRRAFRLPVDANEEKISALHKDGVLTILIDKVAPNTPEPKKIKISKQ
ncbi:MAG: Hsp20/alpha crystallin family protein [Rhodospirillales bacterium]|nr:Hsp20/alpha crystallin family protein [Rhodospirillales bacterium]